MISGRIRQVYDWFKSREKQLRLEAERNGGKLPRHEHWRLAYYQTPYLLLEPDDVVAERFGDVFTNTIDLTEGGKIGIRGFKDSEQRLGRFFTELIEETNWRGILTRDSQKKALAQVHSYFEGGVPLGVRMFKNYELPTEESFLLKFTRQEFANEMLECGRFRISPASYYSKGSHIRAVKDLETIRPYKVVAIGAAMKGEDHVEIEGQSIPIPNGVIPLQFEMDDYYLFSTCRTISRRMPTDFEADAVLVIRNKKDFLNRLRQRLLSLLPEWDFLEGDVYYYDPYTDFPTGTDQEFYKYLSYSYQQEHRCILRPPRGFKPTGLDAIFVNLGPLVDIAEILSVNE